LGRHKLDFRDYILKNLWGIGVPVKDFVVNRQPFRGNDQADIDVPFRANCALN